MELYIHRFLEITIDNASSTWMHVSQYLIEVKTFKFICKFSLTMYGEKWLKVLKPTWELYVSL